MKTYHIIVYPLFAFLLFGCATRGVRDRELERLGSEVSALKRSVEGANARLEVLNNKFILLHEKVEASREKKAYEPPEGLEVVRLGEPEVWEEPPGAEVMKPAVATEPGASGDGAGKSEGAESLYSRGQDLFMAEKYVQARAAFAELALRYPAHGLADNALYWLAESYYTEQDYSSALSGFEVVVDRYPEGNKAPDAQLKVGYSYLEMEEPEKAMEALEGLISRYPDSEAAGRAGKVISNLSGQR